MIRILDEYGHLCKQLRDEPNHRLSKSQKESLLQAGKTDPTACALGLDERMHPVLRAKMPGPQKATRYALDRAGSATAVKGKVVEPW